MDAEPLITALIDLTRAMGGTDFQPILGGGFGLYLKQLHLQRHSSVRTLLPGELWPFPRATEDLDMFLPIEFLASLDQMRRLRKALDDLGFQPVEEAKFLHFARPSGASGRVKVDMLTGPLGSGMRAKLKVTPPRVRPRGRLELHAYLTEEALAIEESLLILPTPGIGSDGRERTVAVHIPQPFTFLLMKLHAFADRMTDPKADLGQHHALDLYRIVAMLTEADFGQVRTQVGRHDGSPPVNRARDIVRTHFASPQSTGSLRLREHPFFTNQMAVQQFLGALSDLFR